MNDPGDRPLTEASRALDEAIESDIAGHKLYPNGAMFINGDEPQVGRAIASAVEENRAVVLCFADGRRHVLKPVPPTST